MEVRNVDYFIPKVKERYPWLEEKQLKQIIEFGLNEMLKASSWYCDISLRGDKDFVFRTGNIYGRDKTDEFYHYWHHKMKRKLYRMRVKQKWQNEGYFYFGVTNRECEEWKKTGIIDLKRRVHLSIVPDYVLLDEWYNVFRVRCKPGMRVRIIPKLRSSNAEFVYNVTNKETVEQIPNAPKLKAIPWFKLRKYEKGSD